MSLNKVQEIKDFLNRDQLASELAEQFQTNVDYSREWRAEKRELREYIFATDTTKTSNGALPWKNKTTRPKLCQIRDNLHANYMAALFPNENWLEWVGKDEESVTKAKRDAVERYMYTKIQDSGFVQTVSQLVLDFIDYGNAFADVVFVDETRVDPKTGKLLYGYRGPKLVRISPFDITFDVTGSDFDNVPKFTRELVSLGELRKREKKYPELKYQGEIVDKLIEIRQQYSSRFDSAEIDKNAGFVVDGFSSLTNYYESGFVELITFEGDAYDATNDVLYEDHQIVIVDRSYIIAIKPIETWSGKSYKNHVGWRLRPDNLMAMGPLDNLVGMQYRIDHLENAQADMMDLTIHPPIVVQGYVEDFDWEPFVRIHADVDAKVTTLSIDSSAFQADFKIDTLEREMEEMAGAPKEAMGIRSPGEKTAFEVGQLQNAASRTFQNKTNYFEENFLEKILNDFLEVSRRNIEATELIRTINDETGAVEFLKVTREDLTAYGTIRARGARHFATRAQLIQEITTLLNSPAGNDESVKAHFSGIGIARLFEQVLGIEEYKIVAPNIRVMEEFERQELINTAQETLVEADQNLLEGADIEEAEEAGALPPPQL